MSDPVGLEFPDEWKAGPPALVTDGYNQMVTGTETVAVSPGRQRGAAVAPNFRGRIVSESGNQATVELTGHRGNQLAIIIVSTLNGDAAVDIVERAFMQAFVNPWETAFLAQLSHATAPLTVEQIAGAVEAAVGVATAELRTEVASLQAQLAGLRTALGDDVE